MKFWKLHGTGKVRLVAHKAGTSVAYLQHIAHGRKRPRKELADALVKASDGELSFDELVISKTKMAERQAGMAQALEHADKITPDWTETAIGSILVVAKVMRQARADGGFTVEDVRLHHRLFNYPEPPHPNSWGAVFNTAAKRGLSSTTSRPRSCLSRSRGCGPLPRTSWGSGPMGQTRTATPSRTRPPSMACW